MRDIVITVPDKMKCVTVIAGVSKENLVNIRDVSMIPAKTIDPNECSHLVFEAEGIWRENYEQYSTTAKMKPYRPYQLLLGMEDTSGLTDHEKERLKRINSIPEEVRKAVEMCIMKTREEVIDRERTLDFLNDFLNGETG